jgi:hypothetical protein
MAQEDIRPAIQITLHPDGVAAPSRTAAMVCREVVDFYLDAVGKTDLAVRAPAPKEGFFRFDIKGPDLSEVERRALYENWILAKAFQDLMRGVRASLEEAFLFVELVAIGQMRATSNSTVDVIIAPFRNDAARRNFPPLLAHVNSKLEKPLEFVDAYQSMQDARNCLEHRAGIVGKKDASEDGVMRLRFPRVKMFFVLDDKEVELQHGTAVQAGTQILMRMDLRVREFKIGERLTIAAADFDEVAFACYYFGNQLAERLPKSAAIDSRPDTPTCHA